MIGIKIDCQRLARPLPRLSQLNSKGNRRDIVLQAAGKGFHVEGAPIVILTGESASVAGYRVAIDNRLAC